MKILLVEDDSTLAESLKELLESDGCSVALASDGEMALDATFVSSFDIFLLDVNIPHIDGFALLQSLRESGCNTPAIFLTAMVDIGSISKGFEIGADDYIKKPFDYDELLIRIRSLVKKSQRQLRTKIGSGNFIFDSEKDELYKEEVFIALSPQELKLARLFFLHVDTTVTKEDILYALADGGEASEGALRVHINKLRKLGLNIANIKGVGYRLVSA